MSQSLRVLLVANSNEIGGGNRSLETLALGLRIKGCEPIIVFPEDGPAVELFRQHSLKIIINPLSPPSIRHPWSSLKSLWAWNNLIRENAIELIHTNGTLAARSIAWAAKINHKPIVCHIRFDFGAAYYQWAFKYLPAPNRFIFVSQDMQKNIQPALLECCPKAKFEVVHNAVILSKQAPLDVNQTVSRIGIIANFQKVKGHEEFFLMAKSLLETNPTLQFDVIGTDIQNEGREAILRKLIAELKIDNNVTFHGHLADIYPIIDSLDLVVCPSHEEPFGRCAIEAMSRGKPVVVTNVGGLPEIVDDQVNGFVVAPKSPNALVKAVDKLIENKNLRQSISKQNVDKVLNHFSQNGHVESILKLYLEETHSKGATHE